MQSDLGGSRELNPGEMGRRYEPVGGLNRHKARISRDLAAAGDLPFKFSKPRKDKKCKPVQCVKCGTVYIAGVHTIGIICKVCNSFEKVTPVDE